MAATSTKRKILVDDRGARWYFDPSEDQWLPWTADDDGGDGDADGRGEDGPDAGDPLAAAPPTHSGEERRKKKNAHKHKLSKWVYVTGLPPSVSVDAVRSYFSRAGIVKEDSSGRPCVRLDPIDGGGAGGGHGGDARMCRSALVRYFKPESVPLAITLLDQSPFDSSHEVRVSLPPFAVRDLGDPADASSSSSSSAAAIAAPSSRRQTALMGRAAQRAARARGAAAASQEALLSWSDAETRRHVVLRHMFDPAAAAAATASASRDGARFYDELRGDVLEEARRLGRVEACFVFRGHPDGAVALKFADAEVAAYCVRTFDGRPRPGGAPLPPLFSLLP